MTRLLNKTVAAGAGLLLAACATPAMAGVAPEEAAQLGRTLTPLGSIKAANASGTIPEYSGGLARPAVATRLGAMSDPFAAEAPILKINAENMDRHAANLSEGIRQLLKTRPGYYLNIFPSHRTAAYPARVNDATVANASKEDCRTLDGGIALSKGCRGGRPFPIPKTGYEVMWNKLVNYTLPMRSESRNFLIDSSGEQIMTSRLQTYGDRESYYGNDRSDDDSYLTYAAHITEPARRAGESQGYKDFLNPVRDPRRAWGYTPGQRRIRMAPEYAYDTLNATLGGAILYDELFLFSGAMDRFDFKLVGKREMYIPYNNYKLMLGCNAPGLLRKDHVNPECERWELHRVWEVQATLKPGKRHVYNRRVYYWDEDNYASGLYEAYDPSGTLHRVGYNYSLQGYNADTPAPAFGSFVVFDLQRNNFAFISERAPDGQGWTFQKPLGELELQPEVIAGSGIR